MREERCLQGRKDAGDVPVQCSVVVRLGHGFC